MGLIDLAAKNNVTIISLPPHCSHKVHPMDETFLSPYKNNYSEKVWVWWIFTDALLLSIFLQSKEAADKLHVRTNCSKQNRERLRNKRKIQQSVGKGKANKKDSWERKKEAKP